MSYSITQRPKRELQHLSGRAPVIENTVHFYSYNGP